MRTGTMIGVGCKSERLSDLPGEASVTGMRHGDDGGA